MSKLRMKNMFIGHRIGGALALEIVYFSLFIIRVWNRGGSRVLIGRLLAALGVLSLLHLKILGRLALLDNNSTKL